MSVYRETRHLEGGMLAHCRSRIVSWEGWPDDVVETLRKWNRDRRLRFVGGDVIGRVPPQSSFECPDCDRIINPSGSTAAQLDGSRICDDCLIVRVRRFGDRGRPETEIEKAKRWQRGLAKKIVRYRHNAIQERVYVVGLMEKADAAASRAHDAIYAEPFDRQDASDAIWDVHNALRPYIDKQRAVQADAEESAPPKKGPEH